MTSTFFLFNHVRKRVCSPMFLTLIKNWVFKYLQKKCILIILGIRKCDRNFSSYTRLSVKLGLPYMGNLVYFFAYIIHRLYKVADATFLNFKKHLISQSTPELGLNLIGNDLL